MVLHLSSRNIQFRSRNDSYLLKIQESQLRSLYLALLYTLRAKILLAFVECQSQVLESCQLFNTVSSLEGYETSKEK
jgi:hypothetical protein